ncbi:alcohol dehydrogenase catalytic domain-containing protein [candidate division KSB3 bacterium]|uniref:Alcohol dehydrogenase catalytic domain-containing protein n=1 Tax=candidate division KSB3 bacterium TaxID=2044937 RepID=A0A9D5JU74_9BACT|nr:alcohol dehydrogenase catalytic domain-containing protein [candidate division KSB3 bacterium]MBD3324066.1 alcohol dehydrogenase catalytic domain-containing protein [candidate division KSB3 bacterium]
MQVVYIEKPGQIAVLERELPVRQAGEALLRVKYCGICGSDIATYTGNQPFTTYPRIPGHEFSAEIVEIDPNDRGLRPGMIVTANPYFHCGTCYACLTGKVNCCEHNRTMGVQRDGAFAEYLTMPVERLHAGTSLAASTLALIEPFSISYHASKRGHIEPGQNVLVVGAGPIGIFAMLSAKLHGATVYITDLLAQRLTLAQTLGADGIINAKTENVTERVQALTDGHGMDVCIEACGLPETFLACIEHVCFGGQIILIGNGKRETTFNHSVLLKKELDVFGSRNSLYDFEPLIDLVAQGKVAAIDTLVTDIFPLSQVIEAFDRLKANDGSMAKVLVQFA